VDRSLRSSAGEPSSESSWLGEKGDSCTVAGKGTAVPLCSSTNGSRCAPLVVAASSESPFTALFQFVCLGAELALTEEAQFLDRSTGVWRGRPLARGVGDAVVLPSGYTGASPTPRLGRLKAPSPSSFVAPALAYAATFTIPCPRAGLALPREARFSYKGFGKGLPPARGFVDRRGEQRRGDDADQAV